MKKNLSQQMHWVLGAVALVPFAAVLSVFLQPMKAAVSFDSAAPFYWLQLPVELSDLWCALFLLVFVRTWLSRRKRPKTWVWGLLFLLCVENAMAVRVAIWRGRLANHPDEISASFHGEAWYSKPPDSFLLNYLLPAGCRLEDVRWITGGVSLRKWLKQIGMRQEIQADLDKDLAGFALGLFRRSRAESEAGNEEGARYWLSQIRYLEEDPGAAREWIGSLPEARADGSLKEYGVRFEDPSVFSDPLPWRKDDYGFGRFLVRFFFGMDILSQWDRRVPRL